MRAIALHTLGPLNVADTSHVTPFLVVLVLQHTRIHIGTTDYSNIASNIEVSVNDLLGIRPILSIPDVNSDNSHVWLRWNLDNSRFECKNNLVKDVVLLEDFFDVLRQNAHIDLIIQIGNSYNFQVGFWLQKVRRSYLILIILK